MNISKSHISKMESKGNLAPFFHSFLQVFEAGFLHKISYFDGKE